MFGENVDSKQNQQVGPQLDELIRKFAILNADLPYMGS